MVSLGIDIAGNKDQAQTSFEIVPVERNVISGVYKDLSTETLHVTTLNDADCEYANRPFGAGKGIATTGNPGKDHEIQLTEPIYYISCEDPLGAIEEITVYL